MARTARVRDYFGIYHITQQSKPGEKIFLGDDDRVLFVETLCGQLERFPSRLLAYCLIEPERYHLIVQFFGTDISQFMAGLNIAYVRAVGRPGGLFKDRYRSEILDSPSEIEALLTKIKTRAGKADRWNSFCTADCQDNLTRPLIAQASGDCESGRCFEDVSELKDWIVKKLKAEGITFEAMLKDKPLRNNWIRESRRHSRLSQKELGALFGNLSESMISKIVKEGVLRA